MRNKISVSVCLSIFLIIGVACGPSGNGGESPEPTQPAAAVDQVSIEPTKEPTIIPTKEPTKVPPTPTPEIEGLVKVGTHIVGTDIEPGIYIGQGGDDILGSCYWARLSNLSGSDDILANDNAIGQFYVEVVDGDKALETDCQLIPLDQVPAPEELQTSFPAGTYMIGRDIGPGIYVGETGEDIMASCYWSRLSNVTGDDDILSNENAIGLYYVEVLESDMAFSTACGLQSIDEVPARSEYLTTVPPGTYLVGRDIEPGTYRGEAGADIMESCYWARLRNVNGDNAILANDNATGQYYIEVQPSDFALHVACQIEKVE